LIDFGRKLFVLGYGGVLEGLMGVVVVLLRREGGRANLGGSRGFGGGLVLMMGSDS